MRRARARSFDARPCVRQYAAPYGTRISEPARMALVARTVKPANRALGRAARSPGVEPPPAVVFLASRHSFRFRDTARTHPVRSA